MNSSTKIFYQDSGYPIQRNLVDLPIQNYSIEKKIGILKVINHVYYKLNRVNPLLGNSHWELLKKPNGIWHFFNGISFGKTPWVVTFETSLPRWHTESPKLLTKGMQALAGEPCRKLIALSDCTKKIQLQYMQENFPSFSESIAPKITVLHPPQRQLINNYDEKQLPDDKLVFTIIGADFFRKGGKEVLYIFDKLLKRGAQLELQIISSMNYGDYASKATEEDLKESFSIIDRHPNHIHHFKRLPNQEVLQKLKNSHIGLLPTYGDTYGYSVLEAQACGCPVISTNIRALPEINNTKCGWVIDVPKNSWGNGQLETKEQRTRFSKIIIENLEKIFGDILNNPSQIAEKSKYSLKRITEEHNPEFAARQLEGIYDKAL